MRKVSTINQNENKRDKRIHKIASLLIVVSENCKNFSTLFY